jgi:hypothetical protein
VEWLVPSLIVSAVLTVALNVFLRAFPDASERAARRIAELAEPKDHDREGERVRVVVPWKAMLVGSLLLTVVVNVLLRLG